MEDAASHPRRIRHADWSPDHSNRTRARTGRRAERSRAGAIAAHRPGRGPRRPRSDARAHLRRAHRLCRVVRQAVRHRRKARHRAPARDVVRVVGGQQSAHAQAAFRRDVPRRREIRRRSREIQHRAAQDDGWLQSPRRARAGDDGRRRRSRDGAPQSVGAVRAAPGPARGSRGDDGLAQGGAGGRRQVRRQSRLLGPVPFRRARRAGPHRARAVRELLEQGGYPRREGRLSPDRRRNGPAVQSQVGAARFHRAIGILGRARAQERCPLQDLEDHGDRLPGHHHQRREERSRAEEPAGQGSARARSLRAGTRPPGHRAGRDGWRSRGRQPVGRAGQPVLREEHAGAETRCRAGEGAAGRGRRAQPQLHVDDADQHRCSRRSRRSCRRWSKRRAST